MAVQEMVPQNMTALRAATAFRARGGELKRWVAAVHTEGESAARAAQVVRDAPSDASLTTRTLLGAIYGWSTTRVDRALAAARLTGGEYVGYVPNKPARHAGYKASCGLTDRQRERLVRRLAGPVSERFDVEVLRG